MESNELIAFELEIAEAFEAKKIKAPVHLSGGNEEQLIKIFKRIESVDWVFSTYRSHYHALLHGIPKTWIKSEILSGRSMTLSHPGYKFFSSAIVGGILPIAVGVAEAIKRKEKTNKVWCFVGDMASRMGVFHEAFTYSSGHDLPIKFVIEDNGLSTDTPTVEAWGKGHGAEIIRYEYNRTWPHVNTGKWVNF